MAGLKAGDDFPEGIIFTHIPYTPENAEVTACGNPARYDASKEFKNKKVILFAVPGAFTPTCQNTHLPSFIENMDKLRAKGVDQVVCIAYNDAWVMSAWGKANGVTDGSILFISDAGAEFSKSIGWNNNERTGRYAIVVDHGKITYAGHEGKSGTTLVSDADAVLSHL
jgi:alkyl hydroperoxide reductase 1